MTVVDASVATAWFVPMATSEAALPIRDRPMLVAPGLLRVELVSSLLKYVRAGLLEPQALHDAAAQTEKLIAIWSPDEDVLSPAIGIAIAHNHKIYDCLYLALALQRREPLATADRRLAALARNLAIETQLIEPSL